MSQSKSFIIALFITIFMIYTSFLMYYRNDIKIFKTPQIWSEIAKNIRYQKNETEEYDSVPDTGNGLIDYPAKDNEKSNFVGRMLDAISSIISFRCRDMLL